MADYRGAFRLFENEPKQALPDGAKGELPGSKIGIQWRFDRDEIDGWIKNLRQKADNKSTGGIKPA